MTQQVKYLTECVKRLLPRQANDEPYGVPGPSWIGSGSQEEPIVISDDEITIKTEKINTATDAAISNNNITGGEESKEVSKEKGKSPVRSPSSSSSRKTISKAKGKGKAPVRKGKAPVRSPSNSGSSRNSCSSKNSGSSRGSPASPNNSSTLDGSQSNVLFYLKKSDMPKDLREALRVNNYLTRISQIDLLLIHLLIL